MPADDRDIVVADLDEEYSARVATQASRRAPRWWYRRQVISLLPRAIRMRVRGKCHDLVRDARYGARMLRAKPVFAVTAILTLTLGIGTTSAVLTLANAILLRPLPYADPDRLVSILEYERPAEPQSGNLSWPDLIDYQRGNQSLSDIAAYNGGSRTLITSGAPAERVPAVMVTAPFFDVLGVVAAMGRTLNAGDMPASAPPVVVLTDASWRKRFGADPSVLGRTLMLNDVSTTIVGVLPRAFEFPPRGQAEFWLPVHPSKNQQERKFYHWLSAIGRLRPGVSVDQATADLNRVAATFAPMDPRAHQQTAISVPALRERIVGNVRPMVMVLVAASMLVLLVACANIAGLLLAQSATRTVELSVRTVMGASRTRLLRQLLAENLAIALPGGVFGILAGQWMMRGLVASLPAAQRLTLPHLATLSLDRDALVISVTLTVCALLVFGALPAWRAARTDRLQSTRGLAGRSVTELRVQAGLVVVQVALALMLLVGAGLIAQSLRRLLDVSPGFRTDHLLTMSVALPDARYREPEQIHVFQRELVTQMAALPGVRGAAMIDQLPLSGGGNTGDFTVKGDSTARATSTFVRTASANYAVP